MKGILTLKRTGSAPVLQVYLFGAYSMCSWHERHRECIQ